MGFFGELCSKEKVLDGGVVEDEQVSRLRGASLNRTCVLVFFSNFQGKFEISWFYVRFG